MTVYSHVPKHKRMELEPSRKKGTFMGHRVSHMGIDCEEQKAPKDDRTYSSSSIVHWSDHLEESVEPEGLVDLPRDIAVTRKRPIWIHDTLQDAERHATLSDTFRERKRPLRFSSYMALLSHIMRRSRWLYQW
jgi:hypothetical protein